MFDGLVVGLRTCDRTVGIQGSGMQGGLLGIISVVAVGLLFKHAVDPRSHLGILGAGFSQVHIVGCVVYRTVARVVLLVLFLLLRNGLRLCQVLQPFRVE